MPKTHVEGGPSYAGHVDVSSPDTVTPEWVAAPEADAVEPAPVEAVEPEAEPKPSRRKAKQ